MWRIYNTTQGFLTVQLKIVKKIIRTQKIKYGSGEKKPKIRMRATRRNWRDRLKHEKMIRTPNQLNKT
jgi:hypothetical protein